MKKTPIFLLFLLVISFFSLSTLVKAENDIGFETQAKTEVDSIHYETDSSNQTYIDNYSNLTAYNGSINWVDFPLGNAKPYLEKTHSSQDMHNYTIKENDNFRYLELVDYNTDVETPSLIMKEYVNSNNNFNLSLIMSYNTLDSSIISINFQNISTYMSFNIYFSNLSTSNIYLNPIYNYNGYDYPSPGWKVFNINNKIYINIQIDIVNNVSRFYCSQNSIEISNDIYPNSVLQITYEQLNLYSYGYPSLPALHNISIYAIDSNRFLKYNTDISDWSPSDYTDSYYSDTRILQTYNVNDKSYNTFDYVSTIADKVNYAYDSNNCSVSYQMKPTKHKIEGTNKHISGSYLVNSLKIEMNQPYSDFNITDSFSVNNYSFAEKYIVFNHPFTNSSIEISNGSHYFGILFYSNGTSRLYHGNNDYFSSSLLYTNLTTSNPYYEFSLGLGLDLWYYPNYGFGNVRNGTYGNRGITFVSSNWKPDFENDSWYISVKNYNILTSYPLTNGSTQTTIFYIKGIGIAENRYVGSLSSNLINMPVIHSNYTEYNGFNIHYFNYPNVSGYRTYQHYIGYINITLDISTSNEYLAWLVLTTENQTNYFSSDNELQHLYGYYLFYYDSYDNYTMNITDSISVYGANIALEFDYTLTYYQIWYYYQYELEDTLFQTIFELLTPIGLLIMFPYAFGKAFGKKGAVFGLLLGIGVLGFSGMVSFTLSLILVLMGLGVGVIVWKSKEGNSEGSGGIYFD